MRVVFVVAAAGIFLGSFWAFGEDFVSSEEGAGIVDRVSEEGALSLPHMDQEKRELARRTYQPQMLYVEVSRDMIEANKLMEAKKFEDALLLYQKVEKIIGDNLAVFGVPPEEFEVFSALIEKYREEMLAAFSRGEGIEWKSIEAEVTKLAEEGFEGEDARSAAQTYAASRLLGTVSDYFVKETVPYHLRKNVRYFPAKQ